jgi:NAD-dependent oxidoreductase involved in siderophore biosynthesis
MDVSELTTWTVEHFEELSWHDCPVHGLAIEPAEYGSGELVLDLDFIVAWLPPVDNHLNFRVAPATLTFHRISDLTISLNYAAVQAGIVPFSLESIERLPHTYPSGSSAFRWRLLVDWPAGEISFVGPGFTQRLRGPIVETTGPCLPASQRGQAGSA